MGRLRLAMRCVCEVRMSRPQVSCELVQCVVPDENAGRHIEDAVIGGSIPTKRSFSRDRASPASTLEAIEHAVSRSARSHRPERLRQDEPECRHLPLPGVQFRADHCRAGGRPIDGRALNRPFPNAPEFSRAPPLRGLQRAFLLPANSTASVKKSASAPAASSPWLCLS
jgi:hypothetical protein